MKDDSILFCLFKILSGFIEKGTAWKITIFILLGLARETDMEKKKKLSNCVKIPVEGLW